MYDGLRETSISPTSNVLTLDLDPSSFSTRLPSSFISMPTRFPRPKLSSSQEIPESEDEENGEFVTCTQPSITVELVGSVKPLITVGSPSLFTIDGPDQFETPAEVIGAANISSESTVASLARSLGMLILGVYSVMNQSTIISENIIRKWSHWGELNPRPSPYQGDAIPLSHSGSTMTRGRTGLIVADLN